jgi:hypothetical protein
MCQKIGSELEEYVVGFCSGTVPIGNDCLAQAKSNYNIFYFYVRIYLRDRWEDFCP